ncbi:MAG: hypothetical protein ACI9N0_002899 [Ilumatobacter sp.]|jgi:hypothetical protein
MEKQLGDNPQVNEEDNDATGRRRLLIKAAVGAGVAVAAHSAPKVSVVPAYALTVSSGTKDGKCYGFGWSSNNPTGKGWMKLSDQQGLFNPSVYGPDSGPSSDAGNNTAVYTWNIAAFGGLAAFALQLTTTGCVNSGGASFSFSGIPSGYRVKLFSDGRAVKKKTDPSTCGDISATGDNYDLDTGTFNNVGKASPTVLGNGVTASIAGLGPSTCEKGPGFGKIKWTFDVVPA